MCLVFIFSILLQAEEAQMKRSTGWGVPLVLAFVVLVLLACGEASPGNSGSTIDKTAASATSAPAKVFKPGDPVNVGSTWLVTIGSTSKPAPDDFNQPGAGNEFVAVEVTMKNLSSQPQDSAPTTDWILRDQQGTQVSTNDMDDFDSSSPAYPAPRGTIPAGQQVHGYLVFQVSTTSASYTLTFQPNLFDNTLAQWALTLPG